MSLDTTAHINIRIKGGPSSGWFGPEKGGTHIGKMRGEIPVGAGPGVIDKAGSRFLNKLASAYNRTPTKWSTNNEMAITTVKTMSAIGVLDEMGYTGFNNQAQYNDVKSVFAQWAISSNNDPKSMDLQRTAAQLFGSEMSDWQKELKVGDLRSDNIRGGTPAILQATYDRTQAELAAAKIDRVTLYRGTFAGGDKIEPGPVKVKGNSLESWTLDPEVAASFSYIGGERGSILAMSVPRELIVSTPVTGFGCLKEAEFVILGGYGGDAEVLKW